MQVLNPPTKNGIIMRIKKTVLAALLIGSFDAHAGVILGGSTLVGTAGLSQLESWLGQGQLALTNIFTKTTGSTASNFHAAANGRGPTFSLMSASEDGGVTWKTIGGYNPASWDNTTGYRYSDNQSLWTAFIFNLSDGAKKNQINGHQTYNDVTYGPTFGSGNDIHANSTLSLGHSYGYSYGTVDGRSIVDGSPYDGTNMRIAALEVFSIAGFTPAPAGVPEPASLSLIGVGMLGWAVARRRKAALA